MPFENERNRETTIEDAVRLHLSGGCLRQPPLVLPTPKRAAAAASAQTTPSAERSEARAGCVRRRHLCRVASPLVMAASNARQTASDCRLGAHRACSAATTPCCAGGSATRYNSRLRRRSLRLRCAPSSSPAALPSRDFGASRSRARRLGPESLGVCEEGSGPPWSSREEPEAERGVRVQEGERVSRESSRRGTQEGTRILRVAETAAGSPIGW